MSSKFSDIDLELLLREGDVHSIDELIQHLSRRARDFEKRAMEEQNTSDYQRFLAASVVYVRCADTLEKIRNGA